MDGHGKAIIKKTRPIIERLVERLRAGYAPERVILFGSHAYGAPRPDSDIDLLVVKETTAGPLDRWTEVRRILSDPSRTVGLEVWVVTPSELAARLEAGDQFVAEIIERGEVLYAA